MADDQQMTVSVPLGANSEPPQVRIINARGAAWQLVLAQLAELVGLGCVTAALLVGKLSSAEFLGALAYCLGGNVVAKIRGGKVTAASTTASLVALGPAVAKGVAAASAAKHVLMVMVLPIAVVAALLCSSCARNAYEPDWPAVHRTAEAMRSDVASLVGKSQAAKGARDTVCALMPDTAECRSLGQLYDATQQALATFSNAITVYESAGVGGERVEGAVRELHARVDDFVVSAQKTVAALDGLEPPGAGP